MLESSVNAKYVNVFDISEIRETNAKIRSIVFLNVRLKSYTRNVKAR